MNPMTEKQNWTVVSEKSKKEKMSIDGPPANSRPIKETMTIEPDLMGFVVGGNGCNLERLKKIYGVKFILPPRGGSLLAIVGPAEMVSAVKKDIEQNLISRTSFFIEKEYLHLVIGQDGEKVRALEDALNVRTKIKQDGQVIIKGTRCDETKNAIESMIKRLKTDYPFEEIVCVPTNLMAFVSGENGSNLKRIESTFSVHLYISTATAKGESKMISVKGSVVENALAAKQYILNLEAMVFEWDLDESFVRRIVGPGGETVSRIEKEYDVNIHFERKNQGVKGRRRVYILGEKDRTKAAKDDIISIITGRKRVYC